MIGLCVITDRALSNGLSESEVAELAYIGGADIVQLRMKASDGKEMLEQARSIRAISKKYAKMFIVNDRVDIAFLSDADGVHLGQSDIPIEDARRILGKDKIIGVSVHNTEEAADAESRGADYVSVGSIYRTSTKPDAQHGKGIDAIIAIKKAVNIPVMAIGGINIDNIRDVIAAGADGAAVVSAVVSQKDISSAARRLREMILSERPII